LLQVYKQFNKAQDLLRKRKVHEQAVNAHMEIKQQFHSFLTTALYAGERSPSLHIRFTPGEIAIRAH
jgi:hypothetical protein